MIKVMAMTVAMSSWEEKLPVLSYSKSIPFSAGPPSQPSPHPLSPGQTVWESRPARKPARQASTHTSPPPPSPPWWSES